jgi:hypothetical protein
MIIFPDCIEKNGVMENWSGGVFIAPIIHHFNTPSLQ